MHAFSSTSYNNFLVKKSEIIRLIMKLLLSFIWLLLVSIKPTGLIRLICTIHDFLYLLSFFKWTFTLALSSMISEIYDLSCWNYSCQGRKDQTNGGKSQTKFQLLQSDFGLMCHFHMANWV